MRRALRMSVNGFASSSTRSARLPAAMLPVSSFGNTAAGFDVAARSAVAGGSPAATSNSSSSCRLKPGALIKGGDAFFRDCLIYRRLGILPAGIRRIRLIRS
jgi:hypothetical protein